MFDLTQSIANSRRAKAEFYIVIAARLIVQCPDEQKRWRAMAELRKLQKIARGD
jgi:hypothetical protein